MEHRLKTTVLKDSSEAKRAALVPTGLMVSNENLKAKQTHCSPPPRGSGWPALPRWSLLREHFKYIRQGDVFVNIASQFMDSDSYKTLIKTALHSCTIYNKNVLSHLSWNRQVTTPQAVNAKVCLPIKKQRKMGFPWCPEGQQIGTLLDQDGDYTGGFRINVCKCMILCWLEGLVHWEDFIFTYAFHLQVTDHWVCFVR